MKVLARGRLENGLYRFPVLKNKKLAYVGAHKPFAFHSYNFRPVDNKVVMWHHKLGHVTTEIVTKVLQRCNISCGKNKATVCSSLQLAKSHRLPTHLSFSCASKPLELVHTDIWGPASIKATSSAKYFILFLDDYSQYTWFYPLHTKDQALPTFKQFKLQVENQFDARIKCMQSDNGGEFRCFMTFLHQSGILHRFSCPYNLAQNGRVEKKHRHVVETGLALLAHASLPMPFWQYAFQTTTFLINRMPSQVLNHASPYFTLFHKEPDYRFLKVFGCLCYPFIRPYNNHKLQYRSVQCTFLGYSFNHKGYLCLDSATGRVYTTPHVVFDEHKFPLATTSPSKNDISDMVFPPAIITTSIPSPTCSSNHSAPPSSTLPDISTSSYSTSSSELTPDSSILPELCPATPPSSSSPVPHMTTRLMRGITKKKPIFDLSTVKVSEPSTLKQALTDPNWTQAMDLEIAALHRNQTWDLVQQPSDANVIGCKWVYKLKHKSDGSIERYKARLVAKRYNQTHGLDYFETFSPVVKAATIRIILTIALSFKWELRQLDVHNAFLNGDLQKQVYMLQPPGYMDTTFPDKVCRLNKAIYGLKQAPRAWFQRLSSALLQWSFSSSKTDSSMFIHFGKSSTLIVLIYVDDIILTGSSSTQISSLNAKLNSVFALRDLGKLSYFLGIEVAYHDGSMTLSQSKYVSDLLHRTAMFDTKPAHTPGAVGKNLSKFDGDPLPDVTQYRSVVGALQYLTMTRPDIAFVVNKVCQFMQQPTSAHWFSVKRILRYLKGTLHDGLVLSHSSHLTLEGFSDADWGGQPDDRRSTSGYLVYLGGNLVSWSSSKQKVVSRSSAESEYRGLAFATAEMIWMQALLQELCVSIPAIPLLWYDNISAYHMAKNPVFHARTKHIEIDLHFIRDQVTRGKLQLQFIPTVEQPADLLTKNLTSSKFLSLKTQLCIIPRPFHLRGDDKPDIKGFSIT